MLLIILHNNQAPDAEDMAAPKLDGSPFDLHAHGTGVVVDLGNVAQYLSVNLGTNSFGEMF